MNPCLSIYLESPTRTGPVVGVGGAGALLETRMEKLVLLVQGFSQSPCFSFSVTR